MPLLRNNDIKGQIEDGVIVRGTGIHAVRCVYALLEMGVKVNAFLSLHRKTETFIGRPVFDVKTTLPMEYRGAYIIVATALDTYLKVRDELSGSGKVEFKEYCYYEWLFKDVVLLHGNCHMEVLGAYLNSSEEFRHKYSIYPYPLLVEATRNFVTEPVVFDNIDVWIHQDIRDDNRFGYNVSDTYIRSHIKKEVKEICIPHIYGLGRMFFPQLVFSNDGNEAINDGLDRDGIFLYGDSIIEYCISRNMSINDIIKYCNRDDALSYDTITGNFTYNLKKLKVREEKWDIKLYDFVLEHYKNYKLFYDPGHPTNVIMRYIAEEVLTILNINSDNIHCEKKMDAHEKFVYPAVKHVLGLNWDEGEIRKTGKKLAEIMDFPEFIREYCWWRHRNYYEAFGENENDI